MKSASDPHSASSRITPVTVAIVACVGLYLLLAIRLAFPIQGYCGDEGFFALAARSVTYGLKPYRDFLFIQMPLLAYAYGAWFSIFGVSITSGRALSVFMTACAIACVMMSCHRRAGLWPAVLAGLLWSTSIYTAWDLSLIKTQSLCNVLIAAALFAIPTHDTSRRLARAALAMGLMSLAFFTRLTLVIPLVLLWLYLAWEFRRQFAGYLLVLAANILLIALAFAFFWADGNMWFGIYVTHHDFYGAAPWTWGRLGWTLKYSLGNQFVIATLLLLAGVRFCTMLTDRARWPELLFPAYCLASYVAVTLAHWSQVQSYPTHQTVLTSFAVVFIALLLAPAVNVIAERYRVSGLAALVCFVTMCSPFSECGIAPLVDGEKKPDWLKQAATILRRHAEPGAELLTFNLELAIDGKYSVFPGCELGEWSYFAGLPEEVAEKRRVLNARRLYTAIREAKTPIVTITDRDFGIMAAGNPEAAKTLKSLLDDHYYNVGIVKKYGQFAQDLYIFKRLSKDKPE
jgi:hypothetical protein